MKIRQDNSCESSALQAIHIKCQYFFFSKKHTKMKLLSAAASISVFRAKEMRLLSHSLEAVK